MTRVVVHIDRIALRGVPASQREALLHQFVQSLESELSRDGVADRVAALGHLATAQARFSGPANAASIGRHAALGVAKVLQR